MAKNLARGPKIYPSSLYPENVPIAATQDFLEGLYTDKDPAQIPINALTVAENVAYMRQMLFRRNGTVQCALTKPDTNQVQNIWAFTDPISGLSIIRFTRNKIYALTATGYVEWTPNGIAANSGTNLDYFWSAALDNRAFFTNGVDPIRELKASTQRYQALGDAPIYKYITGAFNRIIGANLVAVTDIPYQIGWCGDRNYGVWNPITDISAGSQQLISSPTSISDDITGILSTAQLLIVPRQRSIWLGTHLPSATNPFSFFSALPHTGADLPRTILLTDYGLMWVSLETALAYVWNPGEANATDITDKIRRQLKTSLDNSDQVWATWSHECKTYTIFISYTTASTVTTFEWSFLTKTWVVDKIAGAPTCCSDLDYANSSIRIEDLGGTMSALVGSILSLGGINANDARFYGFANGEIETQAFYSGLPTELSNIAITDNGRSFISTVTSKIIEVPVYDTHINLVRFAVTPYSIGSITLEYSKDDGNTWTTAKTVTFVSGDLTKNKLVQIKKSIKARRFMWRITTSDCMCAINNFEIRALQTGVTK